MSKSKKIKVQPEVASVVVAPAPVKAPAQVPAKVEIDPAQVERAKWLRRLKRWEVKADLAAPGLAKELMQEVMAA